ncbi:unnamed protein product [Litomosoides sigmodontis]|uniref:Uncharacterized protein n=1 Tax=Litomosoides sigmodontis TaxID=42156 RepID=A0A3P6U4D5_LITSI|nr:unnamed protein product [Litomosoides sigmodontis]
MASKTHQNTTAPPSGTTGECVVMVVMSRMVSQGIICVTNDVGLGRVFIVAFYMTGLFRRVRSEGGRWLLFRGWMVVLGRFLRFGSHAKK